MDANTNILLVLQQFEEEFSKIHCFSSNVENEK